jgi:hypothetical protein
MLVPTPKDMIGEAEGMITDAERQVREILHLEDRAAWIVAGKISRARHELRNPLTRLQLDRESLGSKPRSSDRAVRKMLARLLFSGSSPLVDSSYLINTTDVKWECRWRCDAITPPSTILRFFRTC